MQWSLVMMNPAPARRSSRFHLASPRVGISKRFGHRAFDRKVPFFVTGLALLGGLGCERTSAPSEAGTPAAPSFAAWPHEVNLIGAGDIAWCSSNGDEATAKLL